MGAAGSGSAARALPDGSGLPASGEGASLGLDLYISVWQLQLLSFVLSTQLSIQTGWGAGGCPVRVVPVPRCGIRRGWSIPPTQQQRDLQGGGWRQTEGLTSGWPALRTRAAASPEGSHRFAWLW